MVRIVNARSLENESDSLKWTAKYQTTAAMEELVLNERLRELCFEGKRWYDLLRYNYRHVEGVDYTTTLADQDERGVAFVEDLQEDDAEADEAQAVKQGRRCGQQDVH